MDVVAPKLGLTVETMEIVEWRKAVGDPVAAGDVVVDITADKSDVEVEAGADGVLDAILAAAGDVVTPGQVIARIAATAYPHAPAPPRAVDGAAAAVRVPVLASPAARRLARELAIALDGIAGSGPGGRIVEGDVRRAHEVGAVAAPSESPAAAPAGPVRAVGPDASPRLEEVVWTAARRATARRMADSARTVAPVSLHRRAEVHAALAHVAALKAAGVPATFGHAALWATATTLAKHPALNAVWDGERLLHSQVVDLAVAVDVDGDLYAPVVRDAAGLDLAELSRQAGELTACCRDRTIDAAALRGGTFTVSNLGMLGVEWFTPIVNHPQVAVLGVGSIVDGRCYLSLTFDHRAVDGAPAARFLADLADALRRMDG